MIVGSVYDKCQQKQAQALLPGGARQVQHWTTHNCYSFKISAINLVYKFSVLDQTYLHPNVILFVRTIFTYQFIYMDIQLLLWFTKYAYLSQFNTL